MNQEKTGHSMTCYITYIYNYTFSLNKEKKLCSYLTDNNLQKVAVTKAIRVEAFLSYVLQ